MGDLDGARRYATTSVEAAEHVGGDVSLAAALTAQVLVSAHAGDLDATRQYAPEATRLFQRSGWIIPSLWSIWALGFVELSIGDAGAAHHLLGPVSQIMMAAGVVEATPAPSIPDDIEAMIALGELDEAEVLLGWLEALGRRQDRAWALATSGRCRALMLAVRGDLDGAAAVLKGALVQHDRIPLPLDRGRTLLILGQVERRRKHKAAAKHAFEQSLAIFDAVGATLWEKRAREELSRVGIRPAAPLELTATEAKVAELAAQGLSSKQVADQAFMSPRSVEGVLARIYRKLGVNSRAELANAVAARRSTPTNLT
jgi:DNA-binding CsgD family transcriptional regulator